MNHGLEGKYFLTWTSGSELGWQGRVVDAYGDRLVMVLLYDWAWGSSADQRLVPVAQTGGWTFYDTAKDMRRASWEYHRAQGLCEGGFENDEACRARLVAHADSAGDDRGRARPEPDPQATKPR